MIEEMQQVLFAIGLLFAITTILFILKTILFYIDDGIDSKSNKSGLYIHPDINNLLPEGSSLSIEINTENTDTPKQENKSKVSSVCMYCGTPKIENRYDCPKCGGHYPMGGE